ncbi:helix-turn-helix domain-containing protein [Priestia megaterium]|uniref:AraC family transcriptional regulator n=1 Tax=Priestia megaterium TaxID=1404 RepID=UPI002795BFCB|nr:AraC family transcriptional regulator [Priestia megaterium]
MEKYKYTLVASDEFLEDSFIYLNRWQESFESAHHFHDCIEITIVEEGKGYHYLNEEVMAVKKGELFVLPLGVSHVFRPSSSNSEDKLIVYNVLLNPIVLQQIVDEARSHNENHFAEWCSRLMNERINEYLHLMDKYDICLSIIRNMFGEFQQRQSGHSVILHAKLKELLINLFRLEHRFIINTDSKISSFAINEVISYMNEHLHETITIADMARLMLVSEGHFLRMFKKYTSQTFTEHLQNIRIEKSCHLLLYTDYTIKEISNFVGYKNVDYFRSLFIKKLGVAPNKFRKKV